VVTYKRPPALPSAKNCQDQPLTSQSVSVRMCTMSKYHKVNHISHYINSSFIVRRRKYIIPSEMFFSVCVQNAITEAKYRQSFKSYLVRQVKSKDSTKIDIIVLKSGLPKPYMPVLKLLIILC